VRLPPEMTKTLQQLKRAKLHHGPHPTNYCKSAISMFRIRLQSKSNRTSVR